MEVNGRLMTCDHCGKLVSENVLGKVKGMVALPDGRNSNHIRTVGITIMVSVYYVQNVMQNT